MTADVSVVLSTISVDDWLDVAIKSILTETDIDIELVLVLDGLSSHLVQEVRTRWEIDPRVIFVPLTARKGLAAALHAGISVSSAPLIARLDADDVSLLGRLSLQKAYLDRHPATVAVGSGAELIDESGRVVGLNSVEANSDVRARLISRNQIIHPSVMFRRSSYEASSGYNPRLVRMQDYELWLRMGLQGPIAVLKDRLIQYRVHPSQSSRGAKPIGNHIRAIARAQRDLAHELGIPRPVAFLRSAIWRSAQYLRYMRVVQIGYDRMIYKHVKAAERKGSW